MIRKAVKRLPITGNKLIPEPLKYGVICIDSYESEIPEGRIWYRHFDKEKTFTGLIQLIKIIESTLNEMEYPGVYNEMRSFGDAVPTAVGELAEAAKAEMRLSPGKLATFRTKIIFRQNASWQGSLSWTEGCKEVAFRSALEMLILMNSALTS